MAIRYSPLESPFLKSLPVPIESHRAFYSPSGHLVGYAYDDAEAASDYWTVAGFVRSTNVVPQQWSVQAVLFHEDDGGSLVTPLSLDTTDTGVTGALQVSTDEMERLILVIAPMTSTQGQPAPATITASFTSSSPFDADLPLELDFP